MYMHIYIYHNIYIYILEKIKETILFYFICTCTVLLYFLYLEKKIESKEPSHYIYM